MRRASESASSLLWTTSRSLCEPRPLPGAPVRFPRPAFICTNEIKPWWHPALLPRPRALGAHRHADAVSQLVYWTSSGGGGVKAVAAATEVVQGRSGCSGGPGPPLLPPHTCARRPPSSPRPDTRRSGLCPLASPPPAEDPGEGGGDRSCRGGGCALPARLPPQRPSTRQRAPRPY